MQIKSSHNAKKILTRLRQQLRVRTDIELSKIMDVRPSTISTWKKRNSLDYSLILDLCRLYKIDLNHLFFGEKKDESSNSHEKTPLITRETIHEYTLGEFNDNMSGLPQYCIPFTHGKEHRVFQVTSNNMFPLLEENSFAICEKLEIEDLPSNDIVAIVSKKKGFFIGYLKEGDSEHFLLLDKTQAFDGDPLKINKEFIDEAWGVRGKINYNIQNETDLLSILNDKIDKIENIVSSSGY